MTCGGDVDVELLLQGGREVDLGQDAETLLAVRRGRPDGLLVGRHVVARV